MDAIRTRIGYVQFVVSDNEIIAVMRKLCLDGRTTQLGRVTPQECREVTDFIVDECRGTNRQLDLRLFVNSIADFAQWREFEAGCHWKDLVSTRVKDRPIKIREAKGREERRMSKEM
jgi:hypothetical protein